MYTLSVAFKRRMSDTDNVGISTLMRRMLPQGSVRTLEMTSMACDGVHDVWEKPNTRQAMHGSESAAATSVGPFLPCRCSCSTHLEELVKGVLGVLARQHQQAPVALALQRRHLLAQLLIAER